MIVCTQARAHLAKLIMIRDRSERRFYRGLSAISAMRPYASNNQIKYLHSILSAAAVSDPEQQKVLSHVSLIEVSVWRIAIASCWLTFISL